MHRLRECDDIAILRRAGKQLLRFRPRHILVLCHRHGGDGRIVFHGSSGVRTVDINQRCRTVPQGFNPQNTVQVCAEISPNGKKNLCEVVSCRAFFPIRIRKPAVKFNSGIYTFYQRRDVAADFFYNLFHGLACVNAASMHHSGKRAHRGPPCKLISDRPDTGNAAAYKSCFDFAASVNNDWCVIRECRKLCAYCCSANLYADRIERKAAFIQCHFLKR